MKRINLQVMALVAGLLVSGATAVALSIGLPAPDIRFPANFDKARADAIHKVLRDHQFKYLNGLYSHWPPAWSTTLVYDGDAASIKAMIDQLTRIDGIHVNVTFSKDLSKESGTGHSAGCWWVLYSHVTPDTLTLRINLARVDVSKLALTLGPQQK